MMNEKTNRTRIILISSLFVAVLTSANRLIALNFKELVDVYVIFFTNFCLSLICWVTTFFAESTFHTKRLKIGWSILANGAFNMLVLFFVLYIIYKFSNVFDYYFTAKGTLPAKTVSASIFRAIILVTVIQTVKYVVDVSDEKQKVELENEILKREKINAQLQSLKQQVNPHFLFNSLNTLKSLIRSNDSNAGEFVVRLSEIYRYILQKNHNNIVAVEEEMKILEAYIFMLKLRFDESIRVEINIDKSLYGKVYLPPFTLQMLIENAIKHNIASVAKPLQIEIYNEGSTSLIVKNNLQPKITAEESTGIGLDNINKRCMYLYGEGLSIVQSTTHFIVEIPLKHSDEGTHN
ncbi:MAG TPA: histidine kinase [Bacteroidales bacterium]|nr:histidine kinase [Bacteroidales bacterium]